MKVLDPGHRYLLGTLDGHIDHQVELIFVKRYGPNYPGNVGSYAGTTIQEVCRALIDRLKYLDQQIPCPENKHAQHYLRAAIWQMEQRAAKRHGRTLDVDPFTIEELETCPKCLHIGCEGTCRS